jgi:hypothetical protein
MSAHELVALQRQTTQASGSLSPYALRLTKDQVLDVVDRKGTLSIHITDMEHDDASSLLAAVSSVRAARETQF